MFQPREEGQGLVEYALILVLVSIVAIVILAVAGKAIGGIFCSMQGYLNDGYFHCGSCQNVALTGNVNQAGNRDYRIDMRAGETITIHVDSSPDFDPMVEFHDPSGGTLTQNDDWGSSPRPLDAQVTYTASSDGIYGIRVNGYAQDGGGFNGQVTCS